MQAGRGNRTDRRDENMGRDGARHRVTARTRTAELELGELECECEPIVLDQRDEAGRNQSG